MHYFTPFCQILDKNIRYNHLMTSLYFFGSDRYASIVLDYLHTHSDLDITHFPDLKSFVNGPMVKWSNDVIPLALSASFPYLFPKDLIQQFSGRLYNLHPSLLPQYRNVAPVPYAIAMGDTETGITLQRIDEKIDHGEIIAQINVPILPTDTTPTLLNRLFTKGAALFIDWLADNLTIRSTDSLISRRADNLIFTKKITPDSGHLEWPLVLKLINGQSITMADTANPLIRLRLTHHPDRTDNILPDLVRALTGYEKVWTVAPTKKGDLRISFALTPNKVLSTKYYVLIPGKPRPISWNDFTKYYL